MLNKNTIKNEHFADGCNLDEKLKYSGLYTDLCGMSVEDYIKAGKHCCCNDNNNDSNDGSDTTPSDKIIVYALKNTVTANDIDNIDLDYLIEKPIDEDGVDIKFEINKNDNIDNINNGTDELTEKWKQDNLQIPLFVFVNDDFEKVEIYDAINIKITNNFILIKTIYNEGKTYKVYAEKGDELTNNITYSNNNLKGLMPDGTTIIFKITKK